MDNKRKRRAEWLEKWQPNPDVRFFDTLVAIRAPLSGPPTHLINRLWDERVCWMTSRQAYSMSEGKLPTFHRQVHGQHHTADNCVWYPAGSTHARLSVGQGKGAGCGAGGFKAGAGAGAAGFISELPGGFWEVRKTSATTVLQASSTLTTMYGEVSN
ncbi:hypothetical protein C0Q70_18454 [Pomacea canaliculata]|uniref:Uncharacterized protein n=1 Tax=Pomacea canaliculata TaxID=400727 RepID=A0A2T7NGK7_POMCA|nr:hypothetical protein C0Q70_18454 [Pomacea canaliculata]